MRDAKDTTADLNHRFGAFIIDWHIRTIPVALWGFALFFRWFPAYWHESRSGNASLQMAWEHLLPLLDRPGVAASGWVCVIVYLLYHPLIELAWHGDSPGKRMMGVRVVSLDGSRPSARQVLIRNLWRAFEFLPLAYAWGMFSIWRSKDNRRTGDVMAGTRVVMR